MNSRRAVSRLWRSLTAWAAVAATIWCQPLAAQTPPAPGPLRCGEPDYAVYETALADARVNGRWWQGRDLIVRATTISLRYSAETLAKLLRKAHPATVSAFLAVNEDSAVLLSCFARGRRITVVDPQVLDDTMNSVARMERFTAFYAAFPGATGILSVSRVGFGPKNEEALVYVSRTSGLLAGQGYLVLLRQSRGRWKIETKRLVVMS